MSLLPARVPRGGSLKGELLVASPELSDPNFHRTVVLLLEHGDEGALGVVLNRASDTAVAEALPAWHEAVTEPRVAFVGGPVVPEGALCLARRAPGSDPEGWDAVLGDLGAVDLERDAGTVTVGLEQLRIFAGHAGWGPGQLEDELGASAWFVLDAEDGDVFTDDPEHLWRDVLRRQHGDVAMVSTYPDDPATN